MELQVKPMLLYLIMFQLDMHGVPEGGQKKICLGMKPIFFESIYPKASKNGRKKIFGVQIFDFLTFYFFSPLLKNSKSTLFNSILRCQKVVAHDFG